MDAPFAPGGLTYLVSTTATLIPISAGQSFRIVNLSAVGTPQYLAWGPASGITVTTPTAGSPAPVNTLGMLGGTERTIRVPVTVQGPLYWIASAAAGFLITQGDGI